MPQLRKIPSAIFEKGKTRNIKKKYVRTHLYYCFASHCRKSETDLMMRNWKNLREMGSYYGKERQPQSEKVSKILHKSLFIQKLRQN